jgi:hypothetical protein
MNLTTICIISTFLKSPLIHIVCIAQIVLCAFRCNCWCISSDLYLVDEVPSNQYTVGSCAKHVVVAEGIRHKRLTGQ